MKIIPEQIHLADKEGFSPDKDIFGLKNFGEILTSIVRNVDAPFVAIIDGDWGVGKTTFMKMWLGELAKGGIASTYFDAFANDYQSDAFVALSSHFIAEIDKRVDSKFRKRFVDRSLSVAKIIGGVALKVAVKAGSAGLVDAESLTGASAEIVKASGEQGSVVFDDIIKKRILNHEADRKAFGNFKNILSDLSQELTKNAGESGDNHQISGKAPLVLVIDELDRCKPTFSLSILETVKHFYETENICIFLVTNIVQLLNSIKMAYGDIDALAYLEKFYHLRLTLPSSSQTFNESNIGPFLRKLRLGDEADRILNYCHKFSPFSLRNLERIAINYRILQLSVPKNILHYPSFSIPLCVLKIKYPDKYHKLRFDQLTFHDFNSCLSIAEWRDSGNPDRPSYVGRMIKLWSYVLDGTDEDGESSRLFSDIFFHHNTNRYVILHHHISLLDCARFPIHLGSN